MDNKPNVTRPEKNLHTDNSLVDQPKGTTRFVLNGVNETESGDRNFIANEEGNQPCFELPRGYILIGSEYIGKGRTAIFLVSEDEVVSEIGIADDDCNYETHVNDALSPDSQKLNFKIAHQIDATYRLRRGCENTIYFVDGDNNKPRYYNFDKPEQFQDSNGDWDANKFELSRSYQSVPSFNDIEVLSSGGQLEPGSYNVAIQYLDEDLNPTEWITSSATINIYNDDLNEEFLDIRGSINSDIDYLDFPITNKSLRVEIADLDQSFLFYRLAFIEATNGTGIVNNVKFTENIPITKDFFIYTGINFATEGTEEEIQSFQLIIDSAETIEQIENRLVLGNVKGKSVDFCKLQKYASRIKADVVTKKVFTNILSEGNTKNPTVNLEAAGYQPGEMYSFGIVYVFADGSTSPVYHIPGKNPNTLDGMVFAPGENVYPMSKNNSSLNNTYIDNSSCDNDDYWGLDSEGEVLKNELVRHHRFPLRSELGLDLVTQEDVVNSEVDFYQVKVVISSGNPSTFATPCSQEDFDAGDCVAITDAPPFQARVEFTVDGVAQALIINIDPSDYASDQVTYNLALEEFSDLFTSNNIVITGIFESTDEATDITGVVSPKGLTYTATVENATFSQEGRIYATEVFGIQFSGVELPDVSDTNGENVIGYYIVRNERTENEKTILDSAAMFPSVTNSKYISHGLLGPQFDNSDRIDTKIFGLVHPQHKFKDVKYPQVTEIIQEGAFDIIDRKYSKARYRDVQDGSSFDSSVHKSGGGSDSDGWSLKAVIRDNITKWKKRYTFNRTGSELDIFYLDALQSRDIEDNTKTVYNIAGDNKIGIMQLEDDYNENMLNTIPYLYLKRDISDSYSTFRTLPYFKASNNISDADTISVFGGDTYITPMRYLNTVFWDNRIAERAGRTSAWNYVIGGVLVVIGAILTIVGVGPIVVGAGIAIIGGGALFISSGVKRDALVRAYNDEYDKGLRETALDQWTDLEYRNMVGTYEGGVRSADTPQDDEIQWIADCVTDLWFESQINISLRNGFFVDTPTFVDAPGIIQDGNDFIEPIYEHFDVYKIRDSLIAPATPLDRHIMNKLLVFNPEREDSREYIGHPLGEYYNVNPDYERMNKQKIYNHLGIEYDCCSDCQEEFPHRVHYSQQSFQEELTDNYRIFLPNDYRDIQGEKGVITAINKLSNNLYIHTEEALWHLPQNYQERVTGDILSFLGTGSFFDVPPRPIVDDSKTSAGTQHKWGITKTKHGILFPSQLEKKWYLFNGNELKVISDYGNSNWFKENMHSIVAQQYYASNQRPYPYLNNPSNPFGEGFISTYDTKKERLIITKKDFSINPDILVNNDYEICVQNNQIVIFNNYQQTIADYEANGYEYIGITNENNPTTIIVDNTPIEVQSRFGSINPFGTLILNQDNEINNIRIKGKKIGNPDYDIRAEIWSLDGSNNPNTLLETSVENYSIEDLTTEFQWLDFTFSGTNYGQNVAILITEFNIVYSASNNALITAFDQTGNLADFPLILSNDNGNSWNIHNDTSLQMELNLSGCNCCKMKFSKIEYEEVTEEREVVTRIPNAADIHVFYDTSGSFGNTALAQLDAVIDDWVANFASQNPEWTGQLYKYNDGTERWVNYAAIIGNTTYSGQNLAEKDIIVISFCNESEGGGNNQARYHSNNLNDTIENPAGNFLLDYDLFTGTNLSGNNPNNYSLYNQYKSFVGIHYPIVYSTSNVTKEFLVHSAAALKGVPYTTSEANGLVPNPGMTSGEWDTFIDAITGANPYPDNGLENFGWNIKLDRFRDDSNNVIDSATFQDDINEILLGSVTTEIVDVTVQVPITVFETVEGEILEDGLVELDNSWTMSFDLKTMTWVSWHSYTPNHFFYIAEKFYGWQNSIDNIHKFNAKGIYQTYFGKYYPHIIEYVSLSAPLVTRIWDFLLWQTEAKRWVEEFQDYVDERFITHNKLMVYNTRQNSGELVLSTKEGTADENYMLNQITNSNDGTIIIDRNERDWSVNDFRDIRTDYSVPMFNKTLSARQAEYFIDKVLNLPSLDFEKDWTQLESFRDKFLVIRFIFDNFDNIRIITNYSIEPETDSIR